MSLRVGVLAVQGAVSEHADALQRAASNRGIDLEVIPVRTPEALASVNGLVMPGGESTTISRLLRAASLQDDLVQRVREHRLALFGTCAGMILLCDRADHDVADKDVQLLGLLRADVDRNAFGRQRDSFEAVLDVEGIGKMPAVFIRAPAIDACGDDVEVLARFDGRVVAARQGAVLGASFHPELTPDTRLHELFLKMVEEVAGGTPGEGAVSTDAA